MFPSNNGLPIIKYTVKKNITFLSTFHPFFSLSSSYASQIIPKPRKVRSLVIQERQEHPDQMTRYHHANRNETFFMNYILQGSIQMISLSLLILQKHHHKCYECSFDIFKDYTISCFKGKTKICSNNLFNSFTSFENLSQIEIN